MKNNLFAFIAGIGTLAFATYGVPYLWSLPGKWVDERVEEKSEDINIRLMVIEQMHGKNCRWKNGKGMYFENGRETISYEGLYVCGYERHPIIK